jgi:hypothetical protein
VAARRLSNWLQSYAEFTEGTESPPIFHLWVALGTIAGAAQRKVLMDAGYYQLHSNMFVILVSPPGRSRKSTALRIGKGILKSVTDYGEEIHFSTQASSVAALVQQMAKIKTKEHQSLTAFSGELGSLLGSKSDEMTDFLVDIYDCDPDWDKQTVGRGLDKIERPWFNLIGATTPQWMGDNLSRTAVEGGFVSRTVFVFDDTRLLVAFPELTEEQRVLRKHLIHDLAQIAGIRGTFVFSPDAKVYYREWYENPKRLSGNTDFRISGFYEREHTHVLKVAMALALARGTVVSADDLVLSVDDIGMAIDMLDELKSGMRRAFSGVGKNVYSTDLERIKNQILDSPNGLTYKQVLSANIHSIDRDAMDKLLSSLVDMGDVIRDKLHYLPPNGGKNGRSRASSRNGASAADADAINTVPATGVSE